MTATYTIRTAPEWQGVRIARLETPPPPLVAPRKPSRRERLLAGLKQIQDPTLRAAFRRRWWREIL